MTPEMGNAMGGSNVDMHLERLDVGFYIDKKMQIALVFSNDVQKIKAPNGEAWEGRIYEVMVVGTGELIFLNNQLLAQYPLNKLPTEASEHISGFVHATLANQCEQLKMRLVKLESVIATMWGENVSKEE